MDTYRSSPEGLAADYFNHFLDLVIAVETMHMFEELGEKDAAAEWKQKLVKLSKDFKTYEAYVSEKRGSFKPDQIALPLNEISKEVPLCTSENGIDFKRLEHLIIEGTYLCLDGERASSFLERVEAAFSPFIPDE